MMSIVSNHSLVRAATGIILIGGLYAMLTLCPAYIFSIVVVISMVLMVVELKYLILTPSRFLLLLPFYPVLPCLLVLYCNHTQAYTTLLHYLFIIIFTFDSASYCIGKLCSKAWSTHKIIPAISPGKSWEGFLGGYGATTILINYLTRQHHSMVQIGAISMIICCIAFAGDIFESFLKRAACTKDSGTLLPGHGGLLDRFDSILMTSYFFFWYKDYLLTLFL